jgi:hypothetical protein
MYDDILERHRPMLDGSDESAGRFTRRVAWDLRATHVLIRKTGGTRCSGPGGGIDCDKVMARQAPHAIYDVVVDAGIPSNRPGWSHARNHDGSLAYGRPEMGVEPEPYEAGPSPTPEPPTPQPQPTPACRYQPPDLAPVLAAIASLREELAAVKAVAEQARDKAAPPVPDIEWPIYQGTLSLPGWLGGGRTITLTPKED